MPLEIVPLPDLDRLLEIPFVARSQEILAHLIGDEFERSTIDGMVARAFSFPLPMRKIRPGLFGLELFHGPTLAFKDFGARFMAQCLGAIVGSGDTGRHTILTATSGDTGAAVAHAFLDVPGIEVVILYPAGGISPLQEKLFCTLGRNVRTMRVDGRFDDCQDLVKRSFLDSRMVNELGLTSANSINVSRLLAQVCYYFEAIAAWTKMSDRGQGAPLVCVPSGNFGNLTAGIIAWRLGLPVSRFIAATNANDVVPQFLAGSEYQPRPSTATLANAMDVGAPNNWDRIVALFGNDVARLRRELGAGSFNDAQIREEMRLLWKEDGYLADPHTAVATGILRRFLAPHEEGIFLSTAHPAKFREIVEETLDIDVELPPALAAVTGKPLLSEDLPNDFGELRRRLLT